MCTENKAINIPSFFIAIQKGMKEYNSTEFEDQGKIEVGSFIFTVVFFPVSLFSEDCNGSDIT